MRIIRNFFFRTKVAYPSLVFFVYVLYRWFGCAIIPYLCGQSLEVFVPIFYMFIYYALILTAKAVFIPFKKNDDNNLEIKKFILIDFFAEATFYITTFMIISDEAYGPYYHILVSIITCIDIFFAFFIFRRGITLRYKLSDNFGRQHVSVLMFVLILFASAIAYFTLCYIFNFLWHFLIAG